MIKTIDGVGAIKKVSEKILAVDGGLAPQSVYLVTLEIPDMDQQDYLRLVRASLVEEPIAVSITTAQAELPLAMPMPGVA